MGNWKAFSTSITGTYHRSNGKGSEDVVYEKQTETYSFIGLADGQTGKARCVLGGKMSLIATERFLKEKVIEAEEPDLSKVGEQLASFVKEIICVVGEVNNEPDTEYSSTLVCIMIDYRKERFYLVHLGDGIVAGISRGGEETIKVLSRPQRGLWGSTFLTTSPSSAKRIQFIVGEIDLFSMLFAFSDGAKSLYPVNLFSSSTIDLLKSMDSTRWERELGALESRDDASMIALFNNESHSRE